MSTILCFVSVAVTLPLVAHAARSIYSCPPCLDLTNAFVRADLSPTGLWALGTQNGSWQPEDRRLLYGFVPDGRSLPGSGFTSLRVAADAAGERQMVASARFAGGQHFEAATILHTIGVPSPTPTAPVPTVAPLPPTSTPEPRPTSGPLARACPGLDGIVPRVVVDAALANPARVGGWLEPENPSLPVGPGNGLKTWLAVRNQAAPYHPLFNSLAFKAGCQ